MFFLYVHPFLRVQFYRSRFLGDEVDGCVAITINPGDVLILPPNWIHCVLTNGESVATGANFISFNFLSKSIDSYILERLNHDPWSQCFPNFEIVLLGYLWMCATIVDPTNRIPALVDNELQQQALLALKYGNKQYVDTLVAEFTRSVPTFNWDAIQRTISANK